MPIGFCPEYFYSNPNLEEDKSIEEIYQEIQLYSGEFTSSDCLHFREQTDFMIPLPPLYYEGKFLKGLFLSQGVDYIHSLFPRINELFFSMAYSMWGSIPFSEKAEILLTCYENKKRERWYKKTFPARKNAIFLPLQDADFTNEYLVSPQFGTDKDIDILCISRVANTKNLPLLLEALMLYHKKYKKRLKATLITGVKNKNFDKNELAIISQLEKIAGGKEELDKYIEILGKINYGRDINTYYTRAKLLVLASIYEGKNRSINEACCCNTPVVTFKDFNKYIRGNAEAFPEGAGIYAPEFSAASLCDTIHEALKNIDKFTPRRSYLRENGRLNFLNKCIDNIPYYKENLPEYKKGRIQDNLWIDLAMQDNYQLSFNQFLYGANYAIQQVKLHENNKSIMEFFNSRFGIN